MEDRQALPHNVMNTGAHTQIRRGLGRAVDVGKARTQLGGRRLKLAVGLHESIVRGDRLGDVEAHEPLAARLGAVGVALEQQCPSVRDVDQQILLPPLGDGGDAERACLGTDATAAAGELPPDAAQVTEVCGQSQFFQA